MQNLWLLIIFFFFELFFLYSLSKWFTISISHLLLRLTGSQKITIALLSFLLLPGTIIHELAHAATARLLFVYTGKIEFKPQLQDGGVKLGSAEIGRCDPVRRMLIGFAPVFWGAGIIFTIIFVVWKNNWQAHLPITLLLLIAYLIFLIANTMFSSRKDLEGAIEAFSLIAIFGAILYFTNLWQAFAWVNHWIDYTLVLQTIKTADMFLLLPIVLDLLLIAALRLLLKIR